MASAPSTSRPRTWPGRSARSRRARAYRVPSDNPGAAQRTVGEYAELGALDSYRRTADAAQSRLAAMDSAMADIVEKLTASISTAQGARGSEVTPEARAAIADAIEGMRDSVLSTVNVPYQGSSLFSGRRRPGGLREHRHRLDLPGRRRDGAGRGRARPRWRRRGTDRRSLQGSAAEDLFTVFDDLVDPIRPATTPAWARAWMPQAGFDRAILAQGGWGPTSTACRRTGAA